MALTQSATSERVLETRTGPGCLISAFWFILIGWWAGGIATALAWFLNNTIIGLPFGLLILNNIPLILTLQPSQRQIVTREQDGRIVVAERDLPQYPFLLRAAFFLLVGWWWSGIWLTAAYILCVTLILMPFGFEMFKLAPFMTTLKRY